MTLQELLAQWQYLLIVVVLIAIVYYVRRHHKTAAGGANQSRNQRYSNYHNLDENYAYDGFRGDIGSQRSDAMYQEGLIRQREGMKGFGRPGEGMTPHQSGKYAGDYHPQGFQGEGYSRQREGMATKWTTHPGLAGFAADPESFAEDDFDAHIYTGPDVDISQCKGFKRRGGRQQQEGFENGQAPGRMFEGMHAGLAEDHMGPYVDMGENSYGSRITREYLGDEIRAQRRYIGEMVENESTFGKQLTTELDHPLDPNPIVGERAMKRDWIGKYHVNEYNPQVLGTEPTA